MIAKLKIGWLIACLLLVSRGSVSAGDTRFYVYNAANSLSDNSAQTITCTKTGRLVITTMGQINFFDGQGFSYIDPSKENIYPLSNYTGNYHLYFDKYHHLWLKDTHSVTCVNLTTERFVDSVDDVLKEFGVEGKIKDLFVDHKNVPWLMTDEGLLCVESRQIFPLKKGHELQDMDILQDQYLLLFYDNGVMEVFDLKTGNKTKEVRSYGREMESRFRNSSVLYNDDQSLFQLRNGRGESIMMKLDLQKWEWKTILQLPYHMNNFAMQDSVLYIPSSYGYWTYDLKTEALEHTEELEMATGGKLLTDINAMAFDRQGGMWVGTQRRGLLYSRPFVSPFKVYLWDKPRAEELTKLMEPIEGRHSYKGRSVNCVFRDSRGWEWVGTTTGLQLYKRSSDRLPELITRQNGLLNNVIHLIIEDNNHNIWVGTSYGLSCLKIEDNKVRYINSYNEWDDIPCESFVNSKAIKLADGTIALQMLDHVVEFNPEKMMTLREGVFKEIYPKLIRLMVNGNMISAGQELDGHVILEKALTRTAELNLSYNQNSVTLTFSALNYFRPQQTCYRVRINGLDDTWHVLTRYNSGGRVDRQGQLHLPLVSLKPGSYRIEVQCSMIPDEWDTVPYEWVVNINEPWWRTTGMLLLMLAILLLLAGLNIFFYIRNSNMRALRDNQERSVIKRIKQFAERCTRANGDMLEAIPDEIYGFGIDAQDDLSPEFMETMEKLIPTVLSKEVKEMSMRELSNVSGMSIKNFYQTIMANIYKNPKVLTKKLMLDKAIKMLEISNLSLEDIAQQSGFASPNYFIACFYHRMKMTPEEYRQNSRKSSGWSAG